MTMMSNLRSRFRTPHPRAFRLPIALLLTMVLFTALPLSAAAQSTLSAGGLGLLSEPLDGRARALGGVSVGLSGWQVTPTDPAAAAGVTIPTATASLQLSSISPEGEADAGGSRFPAFGASYPFGSHVVSLQFGSFLDQEWEAEREHELSPSGDPVQARDRFVSAGGIGQARLGWATRLRPELAVGLNVGSYVGAMELHFTRELDPDGIGPGVEPYESRGRWRASGPFASAGVAWDPSSFIRVAGALEWSGDLTLDPLAPTEGPAKSYSMPLTIRAGGTFNLMEDLDLALSVARADWSGVDDQLGGDAARETAWSWGGGVEWTGAELRERGTPVRLGYGLRQLPFHFDGAPVDERALSAGVGVNLVETDAGLPVARLDLGAELGSRSAGGTSEDYNRLIISVRIAGG